MAVTVVGLLLTTPVSTPHPSFTSTSSHRTASVGPSVALSGAKSDSQFPKPVTEALDFVATRTKVPVLGPADLGGTNLTTAQAEAARKSYSVGLFPCHPPRPLNSRLPGWGRCREAGDGSALMTFGGRSFDSPKAATAETSRVLTGQKQVPIPACPPPQQHLVVSGIAISQCNLKLPKPYTTRLVVWQEGRWRITMESFFPIWTSKKLDPFVAALRPLASTEVGGSVVVRRAGSSTPTWIQWAIGDDEYWVHEWYVLNTAGATAAASMTSFQR